MQSQRNVIVLAIVLAQAGFTQTAVPTASLHGRVLSEEGRTLRATVTLNSAAARGYPAPPRRVRTDANGNFTFSRLPAGAYKLCAQVADSEPAPANSPFIDTCDWGSGQPPITVAAGQQVAGIVFTAPKGTWLKLHVNDPDHVLPQPSAKAPSHLEPELQLILKGPDGLNRHARFTDRDSSGRNYQIAIPLKTNVSLRVDSTVANVFDNGGNQLHDKDTVGFQPTTASDLSGPANFTLHKR